MTGPDQARGWGSDPLWYKDAVIYQLHVKAFADSNDDGIGDFKGLTQKLDYIHDLGVNTLWLLPFYPSPMRDDGYDIADYRNIYTSYGTRRDFRNFVREAHRRELKVITELVINHTSDQHPWFQAARHAPPGSPKRDFYVWSDTDQKFPETRIIFTDTEISNWTWDPVAKAYYWHRFFSHQPDLNHNNPQVVRAVIRLMRFWLDLGVDGLRLDAIPYLCVREGTTNENLPETHAVIREMRKVVDEHYENRLFLAEANQWPEDVRDYFGDADECHMAYHFPLMPRMYMAVAQEERHPIVEIMGQTPDIPPSCQWAVFLRNHDELTLEMVTDKERDYMYRIYANDPRMRVNVGIRRRLATLMENDPDKIKLMNSLLLSMPGSPIIYYGDELGMGDNYYLGDRNGVRTPMQWSPDRNAGFSRADPQKLYLPPIMDPIYGFEAVNVESQSRDPSSLLNWMKRMLAVRRSSHAFGRGSLAFLEPGNRKILAYLREHEGESILCVANLARSAQPVELDLSRYKGYVPMELLGHTPFPPIGELPYLLTLPGHGFYWFRLSTETEAPAWHEEFLPPLTLPLVVMFDGLNSLFPDEVSDSRRSMAEKALAVLRNTALPAFMSSQRWFAGKGEGLDHVELNDAQVWSTEVGSWLLALVTGVSSSGERQAYSLPLSVAWGEIEDDHIRNLLPYAVARIRQQAKLGILYDAVADERFVRQLVALIRERGELDILGGRLRFSSTHALKSLLGEEALAEIRRPSSAGSNSAIIVGERLFLKLYRKLQPGLNPELEMGRYLTEASPFDHVVPVAGAMEFETAEGDLYTLGLLHGFVDNQGDAWNFTVDYLERFLEDQTAVVAGAPEETLEAHYSDLLLMEILGQRTAELHKALSQPTDDPDFRPEAISAEDLSQWRDSIVAEMDETWDRLGQNLTRLSGSTLELAHRVLELRDRFADMLQAEFPDSVSAAKIRYHGDYHLGQVLVAGNDFVIIDFEGEPARPLEQRRTKHSALRDVAGMLRSFSYAAAVALERSTGERPELHAQLQPMAEHWRQSATNVFLRGYHEHAAQCACTPDDPSHTQALIDAFVLEKALYELRYELDNRPDWVQVPLQGLLDLLNPRRD